MGLAHLDTNADKALPRAGRLQGCLLGLALGAQGHNGPSAAGELCSSCKQQQSVIAAPQWCSSLNLDCRLPSWGMSVPQRNAAHGRASKAS